MLRKEQFAFGAALVASALAIILSKSLAWFILVIGLALVFDFYVRDLIWGPDRLTREQIEKMPADEYKARVLANPATEAWVNWRVSGYDAFKTRMRKLAREVVIFMLVTPILLFAVDLGYSYHDAHKPVTVDLSKSVPVPPNATLGPPIPGFIPDPYAELGSHAIDLSAGIAPKPISELTGMALLFGLYGFPAGFGLWLLYRAVFFAVKG